jgi:hypothetical protein
MTASSVIARGLSLADLQNSQFVTYQDQTNGLFEAYKDLYSSITANDDDYFINTLLLASSSATQPSPGEFLFTLPSDFYKIRTLEYQVGSYWIPMERFSLSNRGAPSGKPMYRFQGNNLWVLGWNFSGISGVYNLRVHYYPPATQPTFPDQPIVYGKGVTSANLQLITSPAWANIQSYNGNAMLSNRILFYIQGTGASTTIWAENTDTQTATQISTSGTTVTNLYYYKGYLYYLTGGAIYSAAYTVDATSATFAAVTITGTPTVVSFTVWQNAIYYSTSVGTFSCAVTGGTVTNVMATTPSTSYLPFKTYRCYLNSSGALIVNSVNLGGTYTSMTTDQTDTIFVTDSTKNLNALTITFSGATPSISTTSTIQTDVGALGPWAPSGQVIPFQGGTSILPIVGFEVTRFIALSAVSDTDFAYPINSNECAEVMAYNIAIKFKAKQNQDVGGLSTLYNELKNRMLENMRRDDYKMERVSNAYSGRGPFGVGTW